MHLLGSALALMALTSTASAVPDSCRAVSPPYTVALVELYTSQGCSSCPPADRWLSGLTEGRTPLRTVPLALHVGYWDYIGWKDPFARREFNDRQRRLAERNRSRTVYTPEVFVGATEVADWDRAERFGAALAAVNARPAQASIELEAHWVAAVAPPEPAAQRLAVQVRWSADRSARDPQLLLAVKRGGYLTDVQAGENRGERLRNDHVVRSWGGPYGPAGQPLATELTVPDAAGPATLVAIAQDGATGAVLQAIELPLAACEAPAAGPRGKTSAQ
ncbi:MAG TPA: DUF1223 domain-containing protein [Burkholderiaceae bacterium]|jgi:hypothetical protein|nr:DUF1223 domain-containing protein [Burkholderiaceae bacterium]